MLFKNLDAADAKQANTILKHNDIAAGNNLVSIESLDFLLDYLDYKSSPLAPNVAKN